MKEGVVLTAGDSANLAVVLTSATIQDLEILREWKNKNRQFFFHTDLISAEQQQAWFDALKQRPLDLMFIVRVDDRPVGCMGIRLINATWDVYNVILGDQAYGKQGLMGLAFQRMLIHARSLCDAPITLKVLKTNPALGWYRKQGFSEISDTHDYYLMSLTAQRRDKML